MNLQDEYRHFTAADMIEFTCQNCGTEHCRQTFSAERLRASPEQRDCDNRHAAEEIYRQLIDDVCRQVASFLERPVCQSCEMAMTAAALDSLYEDRKAGLANLALLAALRK